MKSHRSVLLAMLLVITLTLSVPVSAAEYTDVPANAWYAKSVNYCTERGYFAGTSETTFSGRIYSAQASSRGEIGRCMRKPPNVYVIVSNGIYPPPGGGWPSIARTGEERRQNRDKNMSIRFLKLQVTARIPHPPQCCRAQRIT